MANTIELPVNAVESATAYFWVDADGVMHINKQSFRHALQHVIENRATHVQYASAGDNNKVKGVALITRLQVRHMPDNFFISFNKPEVPTRLFTNKTAAKRWLISINPNPILL